jgi:hypothetical protein
MKVAVATGMKNPEGDGCAVEADFVWILRGVYPESFGCAQDQLRRRAQNDSLFCEDFNVGHPDFGVGEPAMLRQPIYPAQANRIFWLEWAPGGCVVSYLLSLNGQ